MPDDVRHVLRQLLDRRSLRACGRNFVGVKRDLDIFTTDVDRMRRRVNATRLGERAARWPETTCILAGRREVGGSAQSSFTRSANNNA